MLILDMCAIFTPLLLSGDWKLMDISIQTRVIEIDLYCAAGAHHFWHFDSLLNHPFNAAAKHIDLFIDWAGKGLTCVT